MVSPQPIIDTVIDYALMLLSVFSLYEIGYIRNDTFAIRREKAPSLRLDADSLAYSESHSKQICAIRAVICLGAMLAIVVRHYGEIQWYTAMCSIVLIPIFFEFYNRWRSRYNVWFYPVLVCSRYIPFLLPYLDTDNLYILLLLLLSFPLCISLERFSRPSYRYPLMRWLIPNEQSKTRWRVIYYVVLSIIMTTYVLRGVLETIEVGPIYILCIYRIFLSILTHWYTPKNYLKG